MAQMVIYEDREAVPVDGQPAGDDLWLSLDDLRAATGWELKPEGVCREDICIPVPDDRQDRLLRDGDTPRFNLAEFARLIDQPIAREQELGVWYFGAPGWEWRSRLSGGIAPDFTLPDFDGRLHSLSDYRGRKIFLLCWASW